MSDANVLATIVVAPWYGGNNEYARWMRFEQGDMPRTSSRSHFNRRLHRLRAFPGTLIVLLGSPSRRQYGRD